MKTIFLAAGSSSRMDPISDKNFLEFGGEPLLLKLLKNAHKAGLKDFIIVGSKSNFKDIEHICQTNLFLEEAIITTQAKPEEGMAGGILEGLNFIGNDEPVLIHNGNDYVDFKIIKKVIDTGKDCDGALLGQKVSEYFPGGYLKIDKNNKISSIIEKPKEGEEPSDLVNIVIHFFTKSQDLRESIDNAQSKNDDIYEVALDNLFKTKNFKAVEYNGNWQAIKYPWHVLEMVDIFLQEQENYIDLSAEIAESATLKGKNIFIDSGVKIYENAVISGPCYIGKNAIIGNNALVRNSNIGKNSTVGYNTEIARSWIGENVNTHIAYIGDSIIDGDSNFGAYSCTANLRLDQKTVRVNIKDQKIDSKHQKLGAIIGKGAQIGIGAKLMPGSKTPCKTLIRPGEIWS